MAGAQVSLYGTGDTDLTALMNTVDLQRVTFQGLSLTNYDNTSLPAIAAGSLVEVAGALFKFASEEAITGWGGIGDDTPAYIKLVPAGTTPDEVTAEFTDTAPAWSDAKQGWYGTGGNANHRYVGGLHRVDAATYSKKWIYQGQRPGRAIKIGRSSRSTAGDQVIAGVGFRPSLIIFLALDDNITNQNWSIGFDDNSSPFALFRGYTGTQMELITASSLYIIRDAFNFLYGAISAISADGFTINWTLTGAANISFIYLCLP